jgi:hypothetical protein
VQIAAGEPDVTVLSRLHGSGFMNPRRRGRPRTVSWLGREIVAVGGWRPEWVVGGDERARVRDVHVRDRVRECGCFQMVVRFFTNAYLRGGASGAAPGGIHLVLCAR